MDSPEGSSFHTLSGICPLSCTVHECNYCPYNGLYDVGSLACVYCVYLLRQGLAADSVRNSAVPLLQGFKGDRS